MINRLFTVEGPRSVGEGRDSVHSGTTTSVTDTTRNFSESKRNAKSGGKPNVCEVVKVSNRDTGGRTTKPK